MRERTLAEGRPVRRRKKRKVQRSSAMGVSFASRIVPRAIVIAGVLAWAVSAPAQVALRSPQGGEVRALAIGIDAYQFVPPLRGAVADARNIAMTLRQNGVKDVTALFDAAADRDAVMRTLEELIARTEAGDLVVLTVAGHGVQEPEHVKGSQPDGMDNVFILAGFNPRTKAGTRQRVI